MAVYKDITIEDAYIFRGKKMRNFSGSPDEYNPDGGVRSFCVSLSEGNVRYGGRPIDIQEVVNDGWNVKVLAPREEGDSPINFIRVRVKFGRRPPKIVQISGRSKVELDEESVNNLDTADIESVDLSIRPFNYKPGKVSAYLEAMYVTIKEDAFAYKYRDEC